MRKALALGTIVIMIAVIFTMMANVTGQELQEPDWVAWYNNPLNYYDYLYDTAVDSNGNVFAVGYSYETTTSYPDILTLKYDRSGNLLWKRSYNGPYAYYDYGSACTVDPAGNVYVGGRGYSSSSSSYDYMVLKYNSVGSLMWARTYNGPGSSSDYIYYYGQPIRYDNGRVFVTGYSYGSGTSYDIATICYNAVNGAQNWVQRYHGGYSSDYGRSLDVYNGMVYVAGYCYTSSSPYYYDYVTICYNQFSGAQLWLSKFHNGYNYDYGYDVAVGNSLGIVYTTGYGYWGPSTNSYNINTVAYNANTGGQLWARTFDGGYGSSDYGRGVESDDNGNVYVSGYAYWDQPGKPYSSHYADLVILCYDGATGTLKWVENYNGPRSGYSYEYTYCKPTICPVTGNIAMSGYGYGISDTTYDAIVFVVSPTGSTVMEGRVLPYLVNEYQISYNGATYGPDGSLYICGFGYPDNSATYYDGFVASFGSGIAATVEMNPHSLNLESLGNWVSFKVHEFPDNPEYTGADVDPTTCVVSGVNADLKFGTADSDGKFHGKADRLLVEDAIGAPGEEVEVEIKGKLTDGTSFAGTFMVKAILN